MGGKESKQFPITTEEASKRGKFLFVFLKKYISPEILVKKHFDISISRKTYFISMSLKKNLILDFSPLIVYETMKIRLI